MSLILASQIGGAFDELAAAHPGVTKLIVSPQDADGLAEAAATADALIVRPGPLWKGAERPAGWPGRIGWVHSTSAGVDYYPPWLGDTRWFSCGRGVASDQVADYAIAALYARLRNIEALAITRHEDWKPPVQGSIIGRTVAILGLGSIGLEIAVRLQALGALPVGVRRSGRVGSDGGIRLVASIEDAVAKADDVVVALPATAETRHLVNGRLLARFKTGAHLINIARGSIVHQEDLIAALDAGHLDFATLDVTDPEPLPPGHPLYTHPRVRLTPHISSNWQTVTESLHRQLLDNITAVANDRPPANLVLADRGY